MRECFILFDEMQKTVSHDALLERPKDGLPADGTSDIRPYLFACKFYGIAPKITPTQTSPSPAPFSSVFDSYASISLRCARVLAEKSESTDNLKEALSRTFSLMNDLTTRLKSPMKVTWKPKEWLSFILACFSSDVSVSYC